MRFAYDVSIKRFRGKLEPCSMNPLTGYYRDGCCNTDSTDQGLHTVCCVVTEDFLEFSRSVGNDLSTPRPSLSSRSEKGINGAYARLGGRKLGEQVLLRW